VHDLLLTKRGISAPAAHALRLGVERHKARLHAEFTKARLKRGCITIEDLRDHVEKDYMDRAGINHGANGFGEGQETATKQWHHPRWARINTLKTSLEEQLKTTFADYREVDSIESLLGSIAMDAKLLHVDQHIPDLLAFPPSTDLARNPSYLTGEIVLQDKASCFPAYLLDSQPSDGDCVDACAAPGNKATHLAAILSGQSRDHSRRLIHACERDKERFSTLRQMVHNAGAGKIVDTSGPRDFLKTDPKKPPWDSVGCILLDPSCSGSGIIGRDENISITLPSKETSAPSIPNGRKRKRKVPKEVPLALPDKREKVPSAEDRSAEQLSTRLAALSAFQLKLLLHAFSYPQARKIAYSTCSIYAEENEHVVTKALHSDFARQARWRILLRNEQVAGMKTWNIRGKQGGCLGMMDQGIGISPEEIAEACIRCEKGTKEGTQGFFVAAFVRDFAGDGGHGEVEDEEWEGFSDTN